MDTRKALATVAASLLAAALVACSNGGGGGNQAVPLSSATVTGGTGGALATGTVAAGGTASPLGTGTVAPMPSGTASALGTGTPFAGASSTPFAGASSTPFAGASSTPFAGASSTPFASASGTPGTTSSAAAELLNNGPLQKLLPASAVDAVQGFTLDLEHSKLTLKTSMTSQSLANQLCQAVSGRALFLTRNVEIQDASGQTLAKCELAQVSSVEVNMSTGAIVVHTTWSSSNQSEAQSLCQQILELGPALGREGRDPGERLQHARELLDRLLSLSGGGGGQAVTV